MVPQVHSCRYNANRHYCFEYLADERGARGEESAEKQNEQKNKPCGTNPERAGGLAITTGVASTGDEVIRVGGNVSMIFTAVPFSGKMTPTRLIPGGPLFVWILRAISDHTKLRFKEVGVDLKVGEVYIWTTDGSKVAFLSGPSKPLVITLKPSAKTLAMFTYTSATLQGIKYLCDFDQTLSDDELMKVFLKESPPAAKPAKLKRN
jgi:hypothetical protein